MRGSRRINGSRTAALTLVLLAANIFAPFRTSLARTPLSSLPHGAVPRSAVRVRTVSRIADVSSDTTVMFLARGDDDDTVTPPAPSGTVPPAADSPRVHGADRSVAIPPLHLRC